MKKSLIKRGKFFQRFIYYILLDLFYVNIFVESFKSLRIKY